MSDEQEPYDPTSLAGVPEHGRERLERMRDRSLFTSDLTVNEFLLVRAAGFEPLGLVVGTSIYHIGFQMGRVEPQPGDGRPHAGHVPRA